MAIATVLGAIGSILTGGGLGLIKEGMDIWKDRQERKDAARERDAERAQAIELAKMGMTADVAEREQARVLQESEDDQKRMVASFAHDTSLASGYRWVDAYRSLFRPGMATILGLSLLILAWSFSNNVDVVHAIVAAVIELAGVSIGWFYASRPSSTQRLRFSAFGASVARDGRPVVGDTVAAASDTPSRPVEEDYPDLMAQREDK